MAIDTLGANALASDSVTTAKIANDAVNSAKIGVDVIAAEDLANNSITAAEITNGAVTTVKIAANAVDHTKVGAGLVCGFNHQRKIESLADITTARTHVASGTYTPKYNNSILKINWAYAYHSDQSGTGSNLYTEFWRSADGGSNWMNLLGDQSITATTAQLTTNVSQPRLRQYGYSVAAGYSNVTFIDTTYNTTNELQFRVYGWESTSEDAKIFNQEHSPKPGGYFMVTEIAQ